MQLCCLEETKTKENQKIHLCLLATKIRFHLSTIHFYSYSKNN